MDATWRSMNIKPRHRELSVPTVMLAGPETALEAFKSLLLEAVASRESRAVATLTYLWAAIGADLVRPT